MSRPWFQSPEAQSILDKLQPSDLDITLTKGLVSGLDIFDWVLPEGIEDRLDALMYSHVDKEVGYTFDTETEDRERWLQVFDQQAGIQAVLNTRFGTPMALFGHGIEKAREIHKNDPGFTTRSMEALKVGEDG